MKYKKSAGYTLMELMVIVAVIGVILLLAFNNFRDSSQTQYTKNAVQQAVFAINKARYYAKTNGVITMVSFPVDSSNYSIEANGATLTNKNNFDASSGVLPDQTKVIENTCGDFFFYVDGTPLTDIDPNKLGFEDNCLITIGYENGSQKSLVVHAGSGSAVYE